MIGKKGQGSTEYLVILAVVLIVALVVIGLLGWFPGLAGGTKEAQSEAYWTGAMPFSIMDKQITAAGAVTLVIENTLHERAKITSIYFTGDNATNSSFNCELNISPAGVWLRPGEQRTFTAANLCGGMTCGAGNVGDDYGFDVTIYYDRIKIKSNTMFGEKQLVGRCE